MSIQAEAFDRLKALLVDGSLGPFLENLRVLVAILDSHGVPVAWNPAFGQLRDAIPAARGLPEYLAPRARAEFLGSLQDVIETGAPARVQLELGPPDGRRRYDCLLSSQAVDSLLFVGEPVGREAEGSGNPDAMLEELDRLKAELQETKRLLEVKKKELEAVLVQTDEVVHTDALTLLPNRRWIVANLQHAVNYSQRYGSPLSVSLVDLDNFKEINDTLGHAAGDQVLRYVASEMRDHIRQPDEIGRYGGDEFLVILPNTTDRAASEQANRLCRHIQAEAIMVGGDEIHMSLSIGIAQYRVGVDDWQSLLDRADQAMYQAKREGRGRWAIQSQ